MNVIIEIIFCAEVFVFEMLHTNAGYYNPQVCSIRFIWTQFGIIITVFWDVKICLHRSSSILLWALGHHVHRFGIASIIRELIWAEIFL